MLPTHDVPCPRCGKVLYSAVSLDEGVDEGSVESPKVEHDEEGYYLRCPFCRTRVAMERLRSGDSAAFRLKPTA